MTVGQWLEKHDATTIIYRLCQQAYIVIHVNRNITDNGADGNWRKTARFLVAACTAARRKPEPAAASCDAKVKVTPGSEVMREWGYRSATYRSRLRAGSRELCNWACRKTYMFSHRPLTPPTGRGERERGWRGRVEGGGNRAVGRGSSGARKGPTGGRPRVTYNCDDDRELLSARQQIVTQDGRRNQINNHRLYVRSFIVVAAFCTCADGPPTVRQWFGNGPPIGRQRPANQLAAVREGGWAELGSAEGCCKVNVSLAQTTYIRRSRLRHCPQRDRSTRVDALK